jgi:hypothetical protein
MHDWRRVAWWARIACRWGFHDYTRAAAFTTCGCGYWQRCVCRDCGAFSPYVPGHYEKACGSPACEQHFGAQP